MKKKFKLGVIGAGFMATAIVKGAIKSGACNKDSIFVSDLNEQSLAKIAELGVNVTTDNKQLVNNSEFVLFAVKPQSLASVLEDIRGCECSKFISIMAGVKKAKIKSVFYDSAVARCMPNTPCAIGCGAVGIDLSDYSSEQDTEFIKGLFSSFASVVVLPEEKLNAVTGVSGSSPAYFYLFLKCIVDAGVNNGLTYEEAKTLATSTMIGAGKMVQLNEDKSLDELITAVCSKGGTTIEAMKVFNDNDLLGVVNKAVKACIDRSYELENL